MLRTLEVRAKGADHYGKWHDGLQIITRYPKPLDMDISQLNMQPIETCTAMPLAS